MMDDLLIGLFLIEFRNNLLKTVEIVGYRQDVYGRVIAVIGDDNKIYNWDNIISIVPQER